MRFAENASGGASMQLLRNAVFSAPTSLRALASLRQFVRFACRAAASLATWADGAIAAGADACGVAGRAASTKKLRHRAVAANARRMTNSSDTVASRPE